LKNVTLLVILAWAVLTVIIAPAVDADLHAYLVARRVFDMPVLWQLLGEARSIASNMSILQADLYMHGGAGHFFEEHGGGMAVVGAAAGEEHEHEHGGKKPEASPFNVLFRISDAVRVTEHKHLEGSRVKEIIPWLYYAARLDPNNVTAYSLTAFWLGDRLGEVNEALAFLREGLVYNQSSWELNAETGCIYFQHVKDYRLAERYLSRARELQAGAPHDKFQERYVLTLLAATYEGLGRDRDALAIYEGLKTLFPKDTRLDENIRRLVGIGASGQV